MRPEDLPLTLSHGEVHHWSRRCPLPYAPFSVAQAPPSSPGALVPEASSSTRGWGEVVRHLPEGHHVRLRCPETGGEAVLVVEKRVLIEGSFIKSWWSKTV